MIPMNEVTPLEAFHRNNAILYGFTIYDSEEKRKLADRVRSGDNQAREQLALSLLLYCEKLAWKYSRIYKGVYPRIEYVDLAQLAMLTVLECIDQAVSKHDDPYPYIVVAVRRRIAEYCRYQSGLIRVPETRNENGAPIYSPYKIASINEKTDNEEDEGNTLAETLPTPARQQQHDYSNLYQALEKLKGRTHEVICRRFGLEGYAPESLPVISAIITDGKSKTMAGSYQAQALKQLRKHLEKQ